MEGYGSRVQQEAVLKDMCRTRTALLRLGILFLILLPFCSCASMGSVERSGHARIPEQSEIPVRRVSVAVLSPDPRHFNELTGLVAEASRHLFDQAGITLYVKGYQNVSWRSSDRAAMLQQVADQMRNTAEPSDITLAYAPMSIGQTLFFSAFGGWEGVIDDVYRRHIVLRTKDSRVLLHELIHAFLFSETHTEGLMASARICVIPGVACLNGSS